MVIIQCEHNENTYLVCWILLDYLKGFQAFKKLSRKFSFGYFGGDVKPSVLGNPLKLV